ncbi:hypothetical protein [Thomasclavelia cocleata]|uniref:hypothetical protein n=1 Tax=Thomasclavelia cocleata TaxID=69824 RepID=UPI00272AF532|nr:hypothetical protein [Thomasclavelia cocleata]
MLYNFNDKILINTESIAHVEMDCDGGDKYIVTMEDGMIFRITKNEFYELCSLADFNKNKFFDRNPFGESDNNYKSYDEEE